MLTIALVSALATVALAWLILRSGIAKYWLDMPVGRSLHSVPTPRLGGVAICIAVAVVCPALATATLPTALWVGLALVFGVSLLDDFRALPVSVRLVAHLAAAAVWSAFMTDSVWMIVLSCLTLVWMTNLYNFMDGADGLAGGMSVIGFAALGLMALAKGHDLAFIAFSAAGATAGFLVFNLPPARLFLGDAGSIPLGFLAGALGIWGLRDGLWSIWVPILVFAPFVIDASLTLMLRMVNGHKPWRAHREHLYQLCVLRGWSHRRLLAFAYPVMAGCATLVWLLCRSFPDSTQLWGPVTCLSLATLYVLARIRVARPAQDAG